MAVREFQTVGHEIGAGIGLALAVERLVVDAVELMHLSACLHQGPASSHVGSARS